MTNQTKLENDIHECPDVVGGKVPVLVWEGDSRTTDQQKVVATTHGHIQFQSEKDKQDCLDAMLITWRNPSGKTARANLYQWGGVLDHGEAISFDLFWLDEEFFENNKEAHSNQLHERLLSRFAIKPNGYKVEHKLAA